MTGYKNQSDDRPTGQLVQVPNPQFRGPGDKARWDAATANNRRLPGEDVVKWLDRVVADATRPLRSPGEDDD